MFKNSKYLLLIWVSIMSIELNAQFAQKAFDPLERDSEITRITLENFMKNWKEEPLLNRVKSSSATYKNGQGLSIEIEAPNSQIFLENGVNWSTAKDSELLDTFYDVDMVALQQNRLVACISSFIRDFNSYLPELPQDEVYQFQIMVDDTKPEDNNVDSTPKSELRKYKLIISIMAQDLAEIESNKEEITHLIKVEKEQL